MIGVRRFLGAGALVAALGPACIGGSATAADGAGDRSFEIRGVAIGDSADAALETLRAEFGERAKVWNGYAYNVPIEKIVVGDRGSCQAGRDDQPCEAMWVWLTQPELGRRVFSIEFVQTLSREVALGDMRRVLVDRFGEPRAVQPYLGVDFFSGEKRITAYWFFWAGPDEMVPDFTHQMPPPDLAPVQGSYVVAHLNVFGDGNVRGVSLWSGDNAELRREREMQNVKIQEYRGRKLEEIKKELKF